MKVLFVNSANKKKRISPFILSQAISLQENGIAVDFFTLDKGGLKGYVKSVFKLRSLLKKGKYDIIHAHYALIGVISFFARQKEKLLVSLMGCDILRSYRSDGSLIWLHQLIVIAAKIFAKYFWDFVILKSANMIPQLYPKTKYEVIPNGVDLNLFRPLNKDVCRAKLGFLPNTKYILFPTNPEREEKNFPLAKASFELVKNMISSKIELIIVHKLAYDELIIYYNAVDVCIITSRSEGSPNVIKEAMACNCPIVSTDVGDVKEVVGDTEGYYITAFDSEDVADKIKMALEFGKRTNGRGKIKNLEINIIAKRIINVYKSI